MIFIICFSHAELRDGGSGAVLTYFCSACRCALECQDIDFTLRLSSRKRSTSKEVGIDGWAPGRVTEIAATADAHEALLSGSCPFSSATARAPLKASPAAVVSTACTL